MQDPGAIRRLWRHVVHLLDRDAYIPCANAQIFLDQLHEPAAAVNMLRHHFVAAQEAVDAKGKTQPGPRRIPLHSPSRSAAGITIPPCQLHASLQPRALNFV